MEDEEVFTEPHESAGTGEPMIGIEVALGETATLFVPTPAHINVGSWAGHPNYQCSDCGFAHLDQAKVERHLSIHGKTETRS